MATKYWVGGSGNVSDTAHWSLTSGGPGGAPMPQGGGDDAFDDLFADDHVVFDQNSFSVDGSVVTMDVTLYCRNLNMTAVNKTVSFTGAGELRAYGTSVALQSNVTIGCTRFLCGRIVHDYEPDNDNTIWFNDATFTNACAIFVGYQGNSVSYGSYNYFIYGDINASGCEIDFRNGQTLGTFDSTHMTMTFGDMTVTARFIDFNNSGNAYPYDTSIMTVNLGAVVFNCSRFECGSTQATGANPTSGTIRMYGYNTTLNLTPTAADDLFSSAATISTGERHFNIVNVYPGTPGSMLSFLGPQNSTFHNTLTVYPGANVAMGGIIVPAFVCDGTSELGITLSGDVTATNSRSTSYVTVTNSTAGGVVPFEDYNGLDGGGNTNWLFPPLTNFTGTPTNGVVPLQVQFTDTSTTDVASPITSWFWDFQNNGTATSTDQNPNYTYPSPGTYTVKLTATNYLGSASKTRTDYIIVDDASTMPEYRPSVVSAVSRVSQDLGFPQFVFGGKVAYEDASEPEYGLFAKTTGMGQALSVWRSKVFTVGHRFQVKKITFNLVDGLAAGTSILPVLHVDDTQIRVGTPIDTTNYEVGQRFFTLTDKSFPKGYDYVIRGVDNFFLEFRFSGPTVATIALPIFIDIEVHDT